MLRNQKIEYYKVIRQALINRHKIDEVVNKADLSYVNNKLDSMLTIVNAKADKTYVDSKFESMSETLEILESDINELISGEDLTEADAITAWEDA